MISNRSFDIPTHATQLQEEFPFKTEFRDRQGHSPFRYLKNDSFESIKHRKQRICAPKGKQSSRYKHELPDTTSTLQHVLQQFYVTTNSIEKNSI